MISLEDVNTKNKAQFGVGDVDKPYTCVMCQQQVTLDDSYSYMGENLVCRRCVHVMSEILHFPKYRIFDMLYGSDRS